MKRPTTPETPASDSKQLRRNALFRTLAPSAKFLSQPHLLCPSFQIQAPPSHSSLLYSHFLIALLFLLPESTAKWTPSASLPLQKSGSPLRTSYVLHVWSWRSGMEGLITLPISSFHFQTIMFLPHIKSFPLSGFCLLGCHVLLLLAVVTHIIFISFHFVPCHFFTCFEHFRTWLFVFSIPSSTFALKSSSFHRKPLTHGELASSV